MRWFPPYLLEAGASSTAILLWAELHYLESKGDTEIRLKELAYRIPRRRGKPRSRRSVQLLLRELEQVQAVTITEHPGKPSTFRTHLQPFLRVLTHEENFAPQPAEAFVDPRKKVHTPRAG